MTRENNSSLCNLVLYPHLLSKTLLYGLTFLHHMLFVISIDKLTPFVEAIKLQFATSLTVLGEEGRLTPFVFNALISCYRVILFRLAFQVFEADSLGCGNLL